MLNGKTILITGGTGFFSQKFVETIFRDYPGVRKVIIYSRGESAQYEMQQKYPDKQFSQLRFFLGDVRDKDRLIRACSGVDILIHAAAITQPDTSEYNPEECIKTNVLGTQNVVDAALHCNIRSVISLSSDKACGPINLYGASKLLSDKLMIAANNLRGSKDVRFSVLRFGNVMGSRGSVIPLFLKQREMFSNTLTITDNRMTRFNVTSQDVIDSLLFVVQNHVGGEIFVPKCPSYRITDLSTAIAPNMLTKEIGIRSSEKIHDQMITNDDAINTIDIGHSFVILPSIAFTSYKKDDYISHYKGTSVPEDFNYSSDSNTEWETVDTLRNKIRKYVNPNFKVK